MKPIQFIKHYFSTLMSVGLLCIMICHTGYAQTKRFEVSLGGQRMAQFNYGNMKGSTPELVLYGDGLLVRYNYDFSISAKLSQKHTLSMGVGSMDIGRTIFAGTKSSINPFPFPDDLPCEANQYAHMNIYGLYTYDVLEFRKWTFQASLGAQFWSYREKYKNYLPIQQQTWAGVTKLGIKREILKNMAIQFNTMYTQTFENVWSNTSEVSYIPYIFGLEMRVGWMF